MVRGPTFVFLLIVCAASSAISLLAFVLMRKVFALYRQAKFTYIFWGVNFLSMAGMVFGRGRWEFHPYASMLVEWIVIWFMAQVFAIFLLPFYFFLRKWLERRYNRADVPVDLSRRRLIQGMALSLPVAAIGVSAYGTYYESKAVRLLEYDIFMPSLDPSLHGFRIAQISDAHIGLFFSVEKLCVLMERLLEKQPEALMLTGDLIDDISSLSPLVKALNEYSDRFPKGIYFTWGNHEYFRDFPSIEKALSKSKVQVLRNQHTLLAAAKQPLYLIGVDYPWAKEAREQESECARMLRRASLGIPEGASRILLSHHPALIDDAYAAGIELSLTGHTHGGQFAILGQALLPVRYKYMRGMYRSENCYGYVSTGAGSWFPFRMGCPAEVAVFTLR